MTHRERLLAPFRGLTADPPAWLADLSYWHAAMTSAERLEPRYQGREGYRQLHRDLGVCCYYGCGAATFRGRHDGVASGTTEEGGHRHRFWRTPVGEIRDHWRWIPEAYCWAHVDYAVKTPADLRVVQDYFARLSFEPDEASFPRVSDFLGDDGLPICPAPRSPLPALLTDWCGVLTTCYLIADEPALVEDTLATIETTNDPAWAAMAASDVELFHVADNLDSTTSTSLFDDYLGDYYARRLTQLHAAGKHAVTHLDGAVRGLLPKLTAVGFDGIESITPQPVGDVAIDELRELAGSDELVLWGGVPGAMFAAPFGDDDLRAQTRLWLDTVGREGRAIVGSADQVPPDGTTDGVRAVAEAIAAWRV